MIILNQNSQNPVTVTVTEKQMTTSSLFLFEFIGGIEKVKTYALAYDSASLNRYNRFCITTTGSNADATQGQVYLTDLGEYTYNIYESPNASLNPVGLNNCEGPCKMMLITGSQNAPYQVYFTGSTTQYKTFQG